MTSLEPDKSEVQRFVSTSTIRDAIKGRESEILAKLHIGWRSKTHIRCPYPGHTDNNPSWRWDERRARAYCTCIEKSHGIFDVVMAMGDLAFPEAKLYVAEQLGRHDLIKTKTRGQKTDAISLLNPPSGQSNNSLVSRYLGARLGLDDPSTVPIPTTKTVGWKSLGYYDPPAKKGKPKLVAFSPCLVFQTVASDGRQHAHRVYLNADGDGKADLGVDANGRLRDSKKSTRVAQGEPSTAGCCVTWGDPNVSHVILGEGIQNSAAGAFSFRNEIAARGLAVFSAITAGGIEAFRPWPNNQQIIVTADRDEDKPGSAGFKRGERAARKLGVWLYHTHPQTRVLIALPGQRGEKYDFIDLYRASGPDGVRQCIANAVLFQPTREEQEDYNKCTTRETELKRINRLYPLPPLLGLHCEYRFTDDARIWLHRLKCFIGGEETGERCAVWEPVSSPFGGIVALIKPGARAAFGLRVHVSSPDGGTNAIDFLRGELFLLAASEVRAALANAGLATANGGESTVIEICKQAQPDRCITVATALGWQADSDISFVDFGDGRW